ncbi:hypothetical protein BST45_14350 [Mycobacterium shinjukuense]|nr:hypothetical protein BST45_14350 [Mycobacterium shinjukuense]
MTSSTTRATPAATPICPPVSLRRRNVIFVAIVLGMLVAALAITTAVTALPTIVADLGGANHRSWVVTSHLLGVTSSIPLAGKFGDLFGRKQVFLAATAFLIAGSVLCGLSQSMSMLVICRALQGVSVGAISVTASALVGDIAPPRYRGRYQGILGAVFGAAMVTAPLVGGLFTDHVNWRWAFWINVPISLVILLLAAAAIPKFAQRPKPVIDYLGMLLVMLGATALTMATSWGGATYAWGSLIIVGLFVGSAVVLGAFLWVEGRVAAPILPIRLFRNPTFSLCCLLAFGVGFAMLGALTLVPTYLGYVHGASPTASGLRMLPMVIGMLLTATGGGALIGRVGRYKIFPVVGTALTAAAFGLMSYMDESTPALLQSLYLFILGAGVGLSIQLLILIVQDTTHVEDLGVATSGVTFFRAIGSAFGTALLGALLANFLGRRLGPVLASTGTSFETAHSPAALHRLPHHLTAPIVRAYCESLTQVFVCAGLVATLGFILAVFLPEVPHPPARADAKAPDTPSVRGLWGLLALTSASPAAGSGRRTRPPTPGPGPRRLPYPCPPDRSSRR